MSFCRPPRVLLADHAPRRARAIRMALERCWGAAVYVAATPEQTIAQSEKAVRRGERFDIVMVSFGFGGFRHGAVLKEVGARAGTKCVVIDERRDLNLPDWVVPFLGFRCDVAAGDSRLLEHLQIVVGSPPPRLPTLSNASRLEELLRLQMQWLSPTHDLAEGKRILCQLVSHLLPSVRRFEGHRLGQGTSGAHVFRISFASLGPDGPPTERVLKLTPRTSHQAWKCQHELENYKEIEADLGGDFRLVPQIHGVSAGESLLPAECGDWFAVLYTFFGGARLAAVDFEHAFIEPEACLSAQRNIRLRTLRSITADGLPQFFLDTLLDQLSDWYHRHASVRRVRLWAADEPREDEPLTFPPYCFRSWERLKIVESIHALDGYGPSLRRARWASSRRAALACVSTHSGGCSRLRALLRPQAAPMARVHGDLNANNVMMALDRQMPFLIDFACYQSRGHAVQDFARLEAAIKIELMGREVAGAPDGRDLDINEFDKWCDAEDWLSQWPLDDADLRAKFGGDSPVTRAYQLCRHLRQRAVEILNDALPGRLPLPAIRLSYSASLIYHTLHTARCDSLPHLKRVFAIYSVGKIMSDLPRS